MKQFYSILFLAFLLKTPGTFGQKNSAAFKLKSPLSDSVNKYRNLGQFAKVAPFAEEMAGQMKKEKGAESAEYAAAIDIWGDALSRTRKVKEAEPLLLEGLQIRKKVFGENHTEIAVSLNSLGVLFYNQGNFPKAEGYYNQAYEMKKKLQGEQNPEVGMALINLGMVYTDMGNFEKAEDCLLKSLDVFKKAYGENHKDIAFSMNRLGVLYKDKGQYEKAEQFLFKSLEINKKVNGEIHPSVGSALGSIGGLYIAMGNDKKAQIYLVEAYEVLNKCVNEDNVIFLSVLMKLAGMCTNVKNFAKLDSTHLRILNILQKTKTPNKPEFANALLNIGILFKKSGQYQKANEYYLQALDIYKKTYGATHVAVASALGNLSNMYSDMGEYQKAEPLLIQAMEIFKKTLGENHLNYLEGLHAMSMLYWISGQSSKAEPFFKEDNQKRLKLLKDYFPMLSSEEKENFYTNKIYRTLMACQSFYVSQIPTKPELAIDLFNGQLATKGVLLSSDQKFKNRLRNASDSNLAKQFAKWEDMNKRISKLYFAIDSTKLKMLKKLQAEAEVIEKELVRKSEDFATLADNKQYDWVDVKNKLKPGEVVVDMIRFRKEGVIKTVIDSSDKERRNYKIHGLTDTIQYAALIIKHDTKYPELVLIKNGNELEGEALANYRKNILQLRPDKLSYQKFWKDIDASLGSSVKRIYFSPDGVYNSINLLTLQNPKTGEFLLDKREIRLLTSSKDLVNYLEKPSNPSNACLVGFPDFNLTKEQRKKVLSSNPGLAFYKPNLTRANSLTELPGTKSEIENISTLLRSKGWKVEALMQESALEETIKEKNNLRLLHISTHGFFEPDSSREKSALLNSGLLFSGANKTLFGAKDTTIEDGILTSFEAMNLNLENTDLVVLSACETGLGEVKNGEGVYGLQRAFKVAGAKSIIMSLWKVSDMATKELMVNFYKNWLSSDQPNKISPTNLKGSSTVVRGGKLSGNDKTKVSASDSQNSLSGDLGGRMRYAFLKAQKQLKVKYPNPYFWGAFVLVGEK